MLSGRGAAHEGAAEGEKYTGGLHAEKRHTRGQSQKTVQEICVHMGGPRGDGGGRYSFAMTMTSLGFPFPRPGDLRAQ